jgi:hypothetical protein
MLTRNSSTCTWILGYYLLGVGLIQLGILAWWQLHGADAGWSMIGLRVLSSIFGDFVGIDQAPRKAYFLSLLWFSGLAVLMARNRRPLKTYIASEAMLLPEPF